MIKAKVFISYSHVDDTHRQELEKRLIMLKRGNFIETWTDRMLLPGAEWDKVIKQELEEADLILLLISPDFLFSDYCFDVEIKKAISMHENGSAVTIPVILRQCDWKQTDFAKLQALPKDAKPFKSWDDPDEYYMNIIEGIKSIISTFKKSKNNISYSSLSANPEIINGNNHSESKNEKGIIEIKIDKNFSEYSDSDQENFLAAIKVLLSMDSEVHVTRRMGSVILDIELSPEQAKKLLDLISAGVLDDYKIMQATYRNETNQLSIDLKNETFTKITKKDKDLLTTEIRNLIDKYQPIFTIDVINAIETKVNESDTSTILTIIEKKGDQEFTLWKPDAQIEYFNRLMEFRSGKNPRLDSLFSEQIMKIFLERLNVFYNRMTPDISNIITTYILSNKDVFKSLFPDIYNKHDSRYNSPELFNGIFTFISSKDNDNEKIRNQVFIRINKIINRKIETLLNDSYKYSQIKSIANLHIKNDITTILGAGLSGIPLLVLFPLIIGMVAGFYSYLSRSRPKLISDIEREISSSYYDVTNNISSFIVSDLFNNYLNTNEAEIITESELKEIINKILSKE